jgi:dolichol-phosphate mannosyltransferase
MKNLVVIPTYNEVENIELLIGLLAKQRHATPDGFDVLFVDDLSPDGTARKIRQLMYSAPGMRVFLLERDGKAGLASAYIAGFAYGKTLGYEAVVEMDADLSHDPACLPSLLTALDSHDFVVGSRYVKNGGVAGWSATRRLVSRGGGLFSSLVLGCSIRDLTGGYNAWRMKTLELIDLDSIISKGYFFQVELKYRAYRKGCTFVEVPILFKDRERGKSKMSKEIFLEAIRNVVRLRKIVP